ncbi:protein takeout-like [Bacillus rossius redtenbacheri]|uniref:protein takeout-like n=1 Tax=Bacillus rossius redtenbacheri TaxID=93214 RepID=UPI002FDD7B19
MRTAVSALTALLAVAAAAKLKPASEYFDKICSYTDPKLNECIKNTVQALRPKLQEGIKDLGLPSLEPLFIEQLVFEEGSGNYKFRQVMSNVSVFGLSQFSVQEVKTDLSKYYLEMDMRTPYMRFEGHYEMEGKILQLPIAGNGECVYNFTGVRTVAYTQGELVTREGQEYFHVKDLKWKIEVEDAHSHFTNLFNGDKNLGEATNTFLNENWKEAFTTFKYLAEDAFGILFKDLANRVYSKFPVKELVKDWPQGQSS